MATPPRACIVVLGDIGRSPRMQYHARSLLRSGANVDFVGVAESTLVEELQTAPRLRVYGLTAFPLAARSLLLVPFKALWMTLSLLWTLLFSVSRPSFILVQNPPSIPTLAVCVLACWLRRCRLIIDWHNFGFTILAMRVRWRALLWFAEAYERVVGRLAHAHLCVSDAMRDFLSSKWGIDAVVLHDCPPEFFRRATPKEKAALFQQEPLRAIDVAHTAVAVTATSWTADERLDMLLDAVELLDAKISSGAPFAGKFALVITGKGDARVSFERRIARMHLASGKCAIFTTYFESFRDYACMLGSANVGISMHASSSGFDLPMKVVDMYGCQLPVCSIRYSCIDELVRHNINGLLFSSARELADQLYDLFARFPDDDTKLARLRNSIKIPRWDPSWTAVCLPLLLDTTAPRSK